ncbi:hypothetical protein [Comamonas sp. GB3 AK4-5]|uniref:hypothetical protein n=1 Tax=Comamonas sp. GB3 AK4-5 TaxID=3231487 RepID=UPI00351F526D
MREFTLSDFNENNKSIPPPDWAMECIVSIRSLWEISAMAGDVAPILPVVKEKKSIDKKWRSDYFERTREMSKVLQSDRNQLGDFVYYDPHLGVNSIKTGKKEKTKIDLRNTQVDVISAIEFLWNRYGKSSFPEGLELIHKKQKERRLYLASKADKEKKNYYFSSGENEAKESAANRQDKANATKEIKRLQAMLYIISCANHGIDWKIKSLDMDLIFNWLDDIEEVGFEKVHGFGQHAIENLVEKCFKAYWELKEKK